MGKKKTDGTSVPTMADQPWFIRTDKTIPLVWRADEALAKNGFPEELEDVGVAPVHACKLKTNKKPTLFHVRCLDREEQILLYAILAQANIDGKPFKEFVYLMDESAKRCVERVEFPDGSEIDHEKWEEMYKDCFGVVAGAIGNFVVTETNKDPLV